MSSRTRSAPAEEHPQPLAAISRFEDVDLSAERLANHKSSHRVVVDHQNPWPHPRIVVSHAVIRALSPDVHRSCPRSLTACARCIIQNVGHQPSSKRYNTCRDNGRLTFDASESIH